MRTLLLADNSVMTQRVVALTFADELFRVVTVSDGQQALDAMAVARPDIVLAGTTLPGTNGYELSAKMRASAVWRDVPVLLLAGAFESVDAARLKECGARGVIEKPLEPTAVISRVRELLGINDARPAAPAGRLVTPVDTAADRKAPTRPAAALPTRNPQVSSWDELRKETREPDARSVEGGIPGREDYLDTLDAAFDSLDQHLAGRNPDGHSPHRNPSGPLGQAAGAADPRSPGRRPSMTSEGRASNSVYEVDADWFGDDTKASDLAAGHDFVSGAHEAMPPRPEAVPAHSIFEVDDEWFAEDEKTRAARLAQQRDLAAEMGIHDVELPPVAPADDLDFDFGLNDVMTGPPAAAVPLAVTPVAAPPAAEPPIAPPVVAAVPTPALEPPRVPAAPAPVSVSMAVPAPVVQTPMPPPEPISFAPSAAGSVADDFAALLAFETGDGPAPSRPEPPPPPAPVVVQALAPEMTEAMLDQIAQQVAERLNAATFGAELREAMTTAVRDTVRSVVAETSERLVRDEIARIKARAERDTQ